MIHLAVAIVHDRLEKRQKLSNDCQKSVTRAQVLPNYWLPIDYINLRYIK